MHPRALNQIVREKYLVPICPYPTVRKYIYIYMRRRKNQSAREKRPGWTAQQEGKEEARYFRKKAAEAEDIVAVSLGKLPCALFPTSPHPVGSVVPG